MPLVDHLQDSQLFDHPVTKFQVVETHISWVLLTGDYVYKIKKPVDFGFLDFSTLEKRHRYCEEEVRLNSRLAPDLYLGVVAITGSEDNPEISGQGPAIEYAVKMRQFPQSIQLDRLLETQGLENTVMDKLANKVAEFHMTIRPVASDSTYGDYDHIRHPVLENFAQVRSVINESKITPLLGKLEEWTHKQLQMLEETFQQRKQDGFVRECHGDMHLRNIALWNDEIIIFDCIEFNENFYWIDIISEIAFLVMDLEDRHQDALARRFLNTYLEITGDYEGIKLLRFYKVYRAMVRAKVSALRLGQEQKDSAEYRETFEEFKQYINLAISYIHPTDPCLLINHGLSGSGKSYATLLLLERYPAILVRSDVERKRLFKVDRDQKINEGIEQSIYSSEASRKTYARLMEIARCLLTCGYSVVIDAANLKPEQRQPFIELASLMKIPFYILVYNAPIEILKQRVTQRSDQGNDASDANLEVLEHQLENYQPLSREEELFAIKVNTAEKIDVDKITAQII